MKNRGISRFTTRISLVGVGLFFVAQAGAGPAQWDALSWLPAGSEIMVHKPLPIDATGSRVFIQEGKIRYRSGYRHGYDQYYPFCYFKVEGGQGSSQTVWPDAFVVTETSQTETEIVQRKKVNSVVQLASLGDEGSESLASLKIADKSYITLLAIMNLSSVKQPRVSQLICSSGFVDEALTRLPTLLEIRETLGDLATLKRK